MSKQPTEAAPPSNDEAALAVQAGASPTRARTTRSLAELETSIHHYPDAVRTEARWLQGFFLEHCQANAISLRAIAAKLGHDKSVEYFYNILNGYYFRNKTGTWVQGGKAWSEFLEMADALRRYAQQASRAGRLPFVQTPTYDCIANFITAKRALSAVCKIGGIIAPTGGQTSESFKFYRDLNNHGQVTHLEAPANGLLTSLQIKVLEQYHVEGVKLTYRATREQALRENINETRCLIIDNAQVLYQPGKGAQQPCFNWLRELYDDKRPTIILKFTEEFLNDLTQGAAKGYFEQFIGRMGGLNSILKLPEYAPASDLRVIARSFGLDPGKGAMEFMHRWSRQRGRIRIVFDRLQLAQMFARADKRDRITLADLDEADHYTPPNTGSEIDEGGAS
jgi:hypothetical protein